jgi:hypothetical protein
VRVELRALALDVIDELRQRIDEFPGPAEVLIEVETGEGVRTLRLGEDYRVQNTPTARAGLAQVFESSHAAAVAATA